MAIDRSYSLKVE